ncbi:MAG: helix-turn-helix transcriptional regulator [Colwellia sp.]|nr:helix-turn-helix transcriptional regulator [Colwellia sp.]
MAKPKRFLAQEFKAQLNRTISLLMDKKQQHLEVELADIRIDEIALLFNVNVATLRRWCKEHVQQSPSQYLAIYRIEKAKLLLRQGIKPSAVSKILAFSELKTFCTVFKRYEKMSPTKIKLSID